MSSPDFGAVWADGAAVVTGGNAGAGAAAEPEVKFRIEIRIEVCIQYLTCLFVRS